MTPAEIIRIKNLLPTSLGSDEVRERFAREILERSVFSARMESARYLAKVRDVCADLADGKINYATAVNELGTVLEQLGHSPLDEGGLKNPASIRRLNLILDTQTQMAASVAQLAEQTDAVVYQWPAWELARVESRAIPRVDWAARWGAAGAACGFEGALQNRFIALKSSPIWAELGAGAGGFRDTLGNPYPPFAFGSGMGWLDVERADCIRLGLIKDGDDTSNLKPQTSNLKLSPGEAEIAEAVERYGMPQLWEEFNQSPNAID